MKTSPELLDSLENLLTQAERDIENLQSSLSEISDERLQAIKKRHDNLRLKSMNCKKDLLNTLARVANATGVNEIDLGFFLVMGHRRNCILRLNTSHSVFILCTPGQPNGPCNNIPATKVRELLDPWVLQEIANKVSVNVSKKITLGMTRDDIDSIIKSLKNIVGQAEMVLTT